MNFLSITPSEIVEYCFCPRFVYFMHSLNIPQYEEKRYKVLKGRQIHEEKIRINQSYLRKKIGCIDKKLDVYLGSETLRVRGVIDEVLFLEDGTAAPLDYKYAEYKDFLFKTHRVQTTLYAMLIKEIFNVKVLKGYICYVRSKNYLVEILFETRDFEKVKVIVDEVFNIIYKGFFPKKLGSNVKCIDCCYKNICIQ